MVTLTRIRLMNDYGVQYPLWGDGGPIEDEDRLPGLGIDESLRADLEAWQQAWDERRLDVWDERQHQAEGRRLLKRLQAGAPDGVEFVLHRPARLQASLRRITRPIRSRHARRHRPDDWPDG